MGVEAGPPPVVAVVVASRPGPWFEESLGGLAGQDYEALSVLVVSVGDDEEAAATAARVATVLPDAHLARVPAGTGFAAAANVGVGMVKGVAHVLVCHDDVVMRPSTVRLLLEEAYRSNAGLTCPKAVIWDAPDRLLSVGLGADRLGVTHSLVEPGELDQGQHDAVREVFVVAGGAFLVRTDLWAALGGFAVSRAADGGELELCWRAQLAGARVVVAPQAGVRHLAECAEGGPGAGGGGGFGEARADAELSRLRTLWTCYSRLWLPAVVPVAVAFVVLETVWALVRRRPRRVVVAPLVALWGSVRDPAQLLAARRSLRTVRRVGDLTVWRAHSRGSARLRSVLRPRFERSHQLAQLAGGAVRAAFPVAGEVGPTATAPVDADLGAPAAGGTRGQPGPTERRAPSEDAEAPADAVSGQHLPGEPMLPEGPSPVSGNGRDVPTGGLPAGVAGGAGYGETARTRAGRRETATAALVVLAVVFIGSRHLLGAGLPMVGDLPHGAGGTGGWLRSWWSGPGLGGLSVPGGSSPPALLLFWLLGLLCLGSAPLAAHVAVVAPLLLGPFGAYRAAGRLVRGRGRLVAPVLYATCALGYNAVAQGHFAGLVAYAAAPWLVSSLCRWGGGEPVGTWRRGPRALAWQAAGLALLAALAPVLLLLWPLGGLAMYLGYMLVGGERPPGRLLLAPLSVAAGAWALLSPWSWGVLTSWSALTGAPGGHLLSAGAVLGLRTGPYGGGPLGLALLVAALVPLAIARSWRLAWSGRVWAVVTVFMVAAWALSRAAASPPDAEAFLAPAGAGLAVVAALGVEAAARDLREARFGWRQLVPAVGVVAALAAALPALSWAANGSWSLPAQGAESAYAFPAVTGGGGEYRVLWAGAPGTLPLAAQAAEGGLVLASSLDGPPHLAQSWSVGGAGANQVAADLRWAQDGETSELGRLLAFAGIRYVVVPVEQSPGGHGTGPASGLVSALSQQVDLFQVGIDPAYQVFDNASWRPLVTLVTGGVSRRLELIARLAGAAAASVAEHPAPPGARALPAAGLDLPAPASGRAAYRAVYAGVPPGALVVTLGGRRLQPGPAALSGSQWALPAAPAGRVVARPVVAASRRLGDLSSVVMWLVALWALSSDWLWRRAGRRTGTVAMAPQAELDEDLDGPAPAVRVLSGPGSA